jgi:CMP-N-acetylneuraminic acid synthetase
VEFVGPWITPICLTEQQIKTLWDNLPNLWDAMRRGETFTCKDGLFRLQTTATLGVATVYIRRAFMNFKLNELQNLLSLSPLNADQQTNYIHAQNNVVQYTVAALGHTEFAEPYPTATNLVLFDQLFDEMKSVMI